MNQRKAILWCGFDTMIITRKGVFVNLQQARLIGISTTIVVAACWIYLLSGAGTGMSVWAMSAIGIPHANNAAMPLGASLSVDGFSTFIMWSVMMVGMMVPGSFPHLLGRDAAAKRPAAAMVYSFLGYIFVWLVFSVFATATQYLLIAVGYINPMTLWSTNKWFSVGVLSTAGIYQFTLIKYSFLMDCHQTSRESVPLIDGMRYGIRCLSSSFSLMLLLFVGGVMNLYWIALLTTIVTVEKWASRPRRFSFLAGFACLGYAIWILVQDA